MRLNILLDYLVRHIPTTGREIAPRPDVPPPILPPDFPELFHHPPTTSSLYSLHQVTHRHIRWHRYQQMYVVYCYVAADYIHVQGDTGLTNQFAQPKPYFTSQHRLAILGYPHKMVFQIINRMRSFSITHYRILLQNPSGG